MKASANAAVFDACTLSNFVAIDRLDLIQTRYGDRFVWTDAVKDEIRRGVPRNPALRMILDSPWIPEPAELAGSPEHLRDVDLLRRALGGSSDYPRQHLGEAECIVYLERYGPGTFMTDDRAAYDLAVRRGLTVMRSDRILEECYSFGELTCPHAYQLLEKMRDGERGVYVPPDHTYVCP